jgi:trans-aconitate methyltransferase
VSRAPVDGVDPAWLALRGPADARARSAYAADLAALLVQHLSDRRPNGAARLVDVGAGTGAGARWLRDRLPGRQDWRLVDHDPRLLAAAPDPVRRWARGVPAAVEDLPRLLVDEPADVVTCQALLDILTAEEVDTLLAPAVAGGAAVLLSLSVTGRVDLSPAHPEDRVVADAFDAHQCREGRLGPRGGAYAAQVLRRHGYAVTMAHTPWRLGAEDTPLLLAWLRGRAAAAQEQEPDRCEEIHRWLENREATARRGELTAVVDHVDVLGLPPGTVAA